MTKADLVEAIHTRVGFSKKESADIVEMVFDTIKETLEKGEKIKISGFGNFEVRDKRSRVGRNPQTGEVIEISARRVLTFKPSQVLRSVLNGGVIDGLGEGAEVDDGDDAEDSEDSGD
jgi:integration host factor subunit alpha